MKRWDDVPINADYNKESMKRRIRSRDEGELALIPSPERHIDSEKFKDGPFSQGRPFFSLGVIP
jgi:hypothetical protein